MKHESKLRFTDEEQPDEENVGVESAEQAQDAAQSGGRAIRAHTRTLNGRRDTARTNGTAVSHHRQQKSAIKRRYADAHRKAWRYGSAASDTRSAASRARRLRRSEKSVKRFVVRHRRGLAILAALFLLVALLGGMLSSCAALLQGGFSQIAGTTYPSEDTDMLGAEAAYAAKEAALQSYLDNYESTHSYDEYHYALDEIKHDPYVLISLLTAYHNGAWTLADAEPTLDALFEQQYTLTETTAQETRYRSGAPYTATVCYVTLENFNLSHLPVYVLSEEQLAMYAGYMRTLGNRPDLFTDSGYIGRYGSYTDYDVPPEALADERFAAMLAEAEKYLGYPYVWGGSSPSTSFDCSGFVSWVINHSGWNVGRLGATALYGICTPVSPANARPGDLVFFQGTYKTTGMSHVGTYVGNGMMLHCGDPIQYANLNTNYWQAHFAAFGRLP